MKLHKASCLLLVGLVLCTKGLPGEAACPIGAADPVASSGAAVLIDRVPTAPVIDGDLTDPVWQSAVRIDAFRQVEPIEGANPTERTEVRILYDRDAVYIAIHAFDSEPDLIRSVMKVRDGTQNSDDHISIIIDPFGAARDAYVFQINPLGARTDMMIENNKSRIPEWDAIWFGKTKIDEYGWHAEIAIPFKTLSFKENGTVWGLDVVRFIRRKNEEVRWASISQDLRFENVTQLGCVYGITDIDQGLGLDLQVAGALTYRDGKEATADGFSFEPSINAFYNFTPSLTGSVTYNTDFAEAAVDEREVNLTRFNLFFPETRDFFLRDVGIFEFGDLSSFDRNGQPFFTRRIGLADGEVVDIIGGGKLTGRIGDLNLGLMDVQTDSTDTLEPKNLSVGRAAFNVLSESSLGVIFTNGDPQTDGNNTLVGVDFRYRDSQFADNRVIEGAAWAQRSFSTGIDENQWAWGFLLRYPNDRIDWKLVFKDIGENFRPALGFANRVGIRDYKFAYRYRWRPSGPLRTIDAMHFSNAITDRQNRLETLQLNHEVRLSTDTDDQIALGLRAWREQLFAPFALPLNVTIPPGDFTWVRPRLEIVTSTARPVALYLEVECCAYYDGRNLSIETGLGFRVSRHFFFRLRYEQDNIKLPSGQAVIRVAGVELNLNITPDIQWANLIQYDNVSRDMSLNSRFRWIIRPGTEFFVIINQSFLSDDWRFARKTGEVTLKFGHTLRF